MHIREQLVTAHGIVVIKSRIPRVIRWIIMIGADIITKSLVFWWCVVMCILYLCILIEW